MQATYRLKLLRTRLAAFTMAVLLVLAPAGQGANTDRILLPEIGDPSGALLSPAEEKRLGEAFMRSIRKSLKVLNDPELKDYIQALGNRLAANSDNQTQSYTFFIIDDPTINAFAGPGGYIGVHTGLILAARSESELAGVLAHEIGHITQRHLYRAFDAARKLSLPLAAATLVAILLGAATGSDAGIAALAGLQAGAVQQQINFTRANEQEADRVAIPTLAGAGFDPRAMPDFFERLEQSSRYYGSQIPEFLRTHPVTTSRIADTRGRAEQYAYHPVQDSLQFGLVRAKLRGHIAESPQKAVEEFRKELEKGQYSNRTAEVYGYALALHENGAYTQAIKQLNALLRNDPEQLAYLVALARAQLGTGQTKRAFKTFATALQIYPSNHSLVTYYAEALLKHGQADNAKSLLEDYVRDHDPDPGIYKLMAQAASDAGSTAEGHRYMAEYYYVNGLTDKAIEQLEIALRGKDIDFYLSAQLEARLRQFKDEREAMENKSGSR